MTTWFVSRHKGAVEWARRKGIEAIGIAHLDVDKVQPGDTVIGTLPVSLAAKVCEAGGRYFHLQLDNMPKELRGQELSADRMEILGAKISEFEVKEVRE